MIWFLFGGNEPGIFELLVSGILLDCPFNKGWSWRFRHQGSNPHSTSNECWLKPILRVNLVVRAHVGEFPCVKNASFMFFFGLFILQLLGLLADLSVVWHLQLI